MAVLGMGVHRVQVASHQLGRSGTGTPHVAVLFEDVNGDRITWYGYLSDAALEYTLKALGTLGWDPVAQDGRIDTLNGSDLLVGVEVDVVVEMETYNGELRPKVKWINEPGGGMGEGMAPDEANAFAAQLRAKILSAPRPRPSTRPGPAKAPAPAPAGTAPSDGFDDSDLPF